jgi:hypothetical protein
MHWGRKAVSKPPVLWLIYLMKEKWKAKKELYAIYNYSPKLRKSHSPKPQLICGRFGYL